MPKTVALYDRDGVTQLPGKTLANIIAGTVDTPVKLGVKNTGDPLASTLTAAPAQEGTSDGWTQLRIGRDLVTLSSPWSVLATLSGLGAGGIWGGTGTVYYVVTSLSAIGESGPCDAVQAVIDDTSRKVTVSWEIVPAATGYKLYRATSPTVFPASSLIATLVGGGVTSFVDDGTGPAIGTPPTANTTGGAAPAYGFAPALSVTPVTLGATPTGKMVFLWIARVVPLGTDDALNPRIAAIEFSE